MSAVEINRPARQPVSVNGTVISRASIAEEAQHHPAASPGASMQKAAEALVVRELLLQEARRREIVAEAIVDERGRRETAEEALVRALVDSAVSVPEPTAAEIARYYEANRMRFRSPVLYEARHILVAARRDDAPAYAAARERAVAIVDELSARPDAFSELARAWSGCSSSGEGGSLGQIAAEETTPEFARALSDLAEGETTREPVATRYGFHVIRLDRRLPGRQLPLDAVASRIAAYLVERSRRLAAAQFVARLVSAAEITGIALPGAEALRVH